MKSRIIPLSSLLVFFLPAGSFALKIDSIQVEFSKFGKISVYKSKAVPRSVILFAAGDKGWNWRTISMMHSIRSRDEIYIGINTRRYLNNLEREKSECLYPAADFEQLSKFVQQKLGIRKDLPTILIGYSAGADLVYGTLCQAPKGVFRGAIVIGFCPDIAIGKPFCKGSGEFEMIPWQDKNGYNFGPCVNLPEPFISLQGMKDDICNYQHTKSFLQEVNNATMIKLPHTGHLYLVYKRWIPYMKTELQKLKANQPDQHIS